MGGTRIRFLLAAACVTAAAYAAAPTAAADDVCVATACATTTDTASGAGSCEGGEPFYSEFRGVALRANVGATTHRVYVANFCYASSSGTGYSAQGSVLAAAVTSENEQTGMEQASGVRWGALEYESPSGSGGRCEIEVYSTHARLYPGPMPCPAGGPGMLMPALP